MNIKNELRAMAQRIFNEDLFDTVIAAHKQEMAASGLTMEERDYMEGMKALSVCWMTGKKRPCPRWKAFARKT